MNKQNLSAKMKPSQQRASETFEKILVSAAKLLEAEGFERLTTNKICAAAGLTPPALYRYFPNKYAIVSELGRRLMEAQNKDLLRWSKDMGPNGFDVEMNAKVLTEQVRITREFTGGVAVLKTLYATPQLVEIRLQSHRDATEAMMAMAPGIVEKLGVKEAHRRIRLIIEIGNGLIEMIIENPEMDETALIKDMADIFEFHLSK